MEDILQNNTVSVKVSKNARDLLNQINKAKGIGKIEIVTRLIEWFHQQDDLLQVIILRQVPTRWNHNPKPAQNLCHQDRNYINKQSNA